MDSFHICAREVCVFARAQHALMGICPSGRTLRLLLLLVMALAAVEYLFGSIFGASPLRTYLYEPLYNAMQPTLKDEFLDQTNRYRNISSSSWPKRLYKTEQPEYVTWRGLFKQKETTESSNVTSNLTSCELPPNLGPIPVNKTKIDLSSIEHKFPEVSLGGWYQPPNCTAKHKVAIIIPYRDRLQHLAIFLNHMHPFLMKQQLDYGIFVIEQQGCNNFNRAKLFNVGFVESNRLREGGWQCFVFHDVDLLPMDERNLYTCPRQPRHMSASVDTFNFKLLHKYRYMFGGVSAMTYDQFTTVNGFSNKYWGWGGEDNDMSYRVRKMYNHIARYNMSIARYTMLDHEKQSPNPNRHKLLSQTATGKNFLKEGLSSLEYEVVAIAKHRLFTLVSVNIDEDR